METPVLVSVVTPCFNEEGNLPELIERIRATMATLDVDYEHIVIDNASTDRSVHVLKAAAKSDPHLRLILNTRNFGHVRSPFHAMLQARGQCIVLLASDLQDPPELLPELIAKWRAGGRIVMLVKPDSEERGIKRWGRRFYYRVLRRVSDADLVADATGAGLYDRVVIEYLRSLNDPYPYLRGLVVESGFPLQTVEFTQPLRRVGRSKSSISALYDMAMLGFTTHSRTPLRMVSLAGFIVALLSLCVGLVYLIRKLADWDSFDLGLAPVATGLFFLGAIQLISLGVIGEYVGNIFIKLRGLPLVVESERVNFEDDRHDSAR